ncbi:MAG: hypothetical protein Q4C87_11030 [Actinomycetaceae bacterium]|nr:hypothetical protein [Actinomycetaceae bacterium]
MSLATFDSIGFSFDSELAIEDTLAACQAQWIPSRIKGVRTVTRFSDSSGAQICGVELKDGRRQFYPHIDGVAGDFRCEVEMIRPGLVVVNLFDGRHLFSRFTALDDSPGLYPLTTFWSGERPKVFDRYHLAALMTECTLWDSEETYYEPLTDTPDSAIFAAGHLVSMGIFNVSDVKNPEVPLTECARTYVGGIIRRVDAQANGMTGAQWIRIEVDSMVPMVMAIPADTGLNPQPGNVLSGVGLLVGSAEVSTQLSFFAHYGWNIIRRTR